MIEPVSYGDLI